MIKGIVTLTDDEGHSTDEGQRSQKLTICHISQTITSTYIIPGTKAQYKK